jgi:hypothetical protein
MQKYDPDKPADSLPASPNCVTVFGAGIAGLTVAHELVERGFQVQIWERDIDDRRPERGCDVGGLARTQWAAVNWPSEVLLDEIAPNHVAPFHERPARPITHIPKRFYFRWTGGTPKIESPDTPPGMSFAEHLGSRLADATDLKDVEITVRAAGVSELPPATRKQRIALGVLEMLGKLGHPPVPMNTDDACLTFRFSMTFSEMKLPALNPQKRPDFTVLIRVDESANADASDITFDFRDSKGDPIGAPLHAKGSWLPGEPAEIEGALSALADVAREGYVEDVYMEVAIRNWDRMSDGHGGHRETILKVVRQSLCSFARDRTTQARQRRADREPDGWTYVEATIGEPAGPLERIALEFFDEDANGKRVAQKQLNLLVAPIAELPYPKHEPTSGDLQIVVSFRPRERWLPGEHGYRFFPSFYHHVFDTMKRTPLLSSTCSRRARTRFHKNARSDFGSPSRSNTSRPGAPFTTTCNPRAATCSRSRTGNARRNSRARRSAPSKSCANTFGSCSGRKTRRARVASASGHATSRASR